MAPLALLLLVLPLPAAATPCGMFGATPASLGGCTITDPMGRPAATIRQPFAGSTWRATPLPGYGAPPPPAASGVDAYGYRSPSLRR